MIKTPESKIQDIASEQRSTSLENDPLGTTRSLASKIRGLMSRGEDGFISSRRLVWIGLNSVVWMGSGYLFLRGSEIITNDNPDLDGVRLLSSIVAAWLITDTANHFLLRKILS